MNTPRPSSGVAAQTAAAGRGGASRWPVRAAALLVVGLVLLVLVGYGYPWLVFSGIVG